MVRHRVASDHKDLPMTLAPSDHFNGKTFFNPGEASGRGLRDLACATC